MTSELYFGLTKAWWEVVGVWASAVAAIGTLWAVFVTLRQTKRMLAAKLTVSRDSVDSDEWIAPVDSLRFNVANTGLRNATISQISLCLGRYRRLSFFAIHFESTSEDQWGNEEPWIIDFPVTINLAEHKYFSTNFISKTYERTAKQLRQYSRIMRWLLLRTLRLRIDLVDGTVQFHSIGTILRKGVEFHLKNWERDHPKTAMEP